MRSFGKGGGAGLITNWCQPNRSGIARLEAYFDPNERRYYITPQSAELAIQEEKDKAAKDAAHPSKLFGKLPNNAEGFRTVPHRSEGVNDNPDPVGDGNTGRIKKLEAEIVDLQITNRGKDFFIEQLQKEREFFAQERQGYVEKLMDFNHKVGELETKLLRLISPEK